MKINKFYIKILILTIFFLLPKEYSFAAQESHSWACEIEHWPALVLQNYLNNVKQVLKNITNEAKGEASEQTFIDKVKDISQYSKFKSQASRMYNYLPTWNSYYASFKFYAELPFLNHVPYPLKRDYQLIENNLNHLNDYYESLITNWVSDLIIKTPCKSVQNCDLSWTSSDILSKLIESSDNILLLFTEWISNTNLWSNSNFILVDNNFKNDFWNSYDKFSIEDCSKAEWNEWIVKTIKNSLNKISSNNILSKNAVKDWQEGWALAVWITKEDFSYKDDQRELLKEELSRQWVEWNNSDIILWNFDDSYGKPLSFENNPLTNSVKNTFTIDNHLWASRWSWISFWEKWTSFSESVSQTYQYYKENSSSSNNININDINKINNDVKKSIDIQKRISDMFFRELAYTKIQNTNNKVLLERIVQLHITITNSSNTLYKTTPVAEKLCNTQSIWDWRCKY